MRYDDTDNVATWRPNNRVQGLPRYNRYRVIARRGTTRLDYSRTFIVRSKQAALTHNISGKEIIMVIRVFVARNVKMICSVIVV